MLPSDTVLSKDELLAKVWGSDFQGDANIVEGQVYVRHLRKKLELPLGRK